MGVVDVVSVFCTLPRTRRHLKKRKQFQTVEMKMRIDCEGCERKVRKALEGMEGVSSVEVAPRQHKVTVAGYVDAGKVMRRLARRTGKRVEPWPYVPYDVVAHPYAPGAYDKKAPPGYVDAGKVMRRSPGPPPPRSGTPPPSATRTPTPPAPSCRSS